MLYVAFFNASNKLLSEDNPPNIILVKATPSFVYILQNVTASGSSEETDTPFNISDILISMKQTLK